MKVYYLCNLDLGWDNVVCIATSRMKCIEAYTDGEVILKTDIRTMIKDMQITNLFSNNDINLDKNNKLRI